ncbi:alpha-L-fucosidase [Pedobacter sp. JCM 36344]|uniref:alpha-L-fucosidase n=1 Tax=Pedobacter sp. JCM 36344 TaxID=3374280 RepID=UPI00397CD09A
MKRNVLIIVLLLFVFKANAQQSSSYVPSPSNLKAREKFMDMKFGLFIHWGIYSVLGDGEWIMHTRKIPYYNYKRLADFFNPQEFNAKEWVALAKNSGMKYITITSRHHDGFSMFNTKASPYNIVDATPYKKDPLKELADECVKEGIELRFYYSLLDWGREDYSFGSKIVNGKPVKGDWDSYINFMKTQLTELITNYPSIKGIWFDGDWERKDVNWHYDEIYALIHKLNPEIMIGNNHHLAPKAGEDFQLFEKDLPGNNTAGFSAGAKIGTIPLETCETMNGSWGFNINDRSYKSVKQLVHYLVNAAGRDANFLLNVGPMPNGKIQPEFSDTLLKIGDWMKVNSESIYGTRGNVVAAQLWGVVTAKEKIWYTHVLTLPDNKTVTVPVGNKKVRSATLLDGNRKLKFKQDKGDLTINLETASAESLDTVVKLTF